MLITEMHYDFKIKADKVDSLRNENFEPFELDWLINEAQLIFLKTRTALNNVYQAGFEKIQKRVDDLSTLLVKFPEQPALSVPLLLNSNGVYELKLNRLTHKYFQLQRVEVEITKPNCGSKRVRKSEFARENNIGNILTNPYEKPSFEWSSVPHQFGRSSDGESASIYFYTNNEFTVSACYPEYLKMPKRVWIGTYNSLDGNYTLPVTPTNPVVSSEFPEHTHNEIVDIAVNEAARIIKSDPNFFDLTFQKLKTNE
jgi:hypothetical protein